ncbi:hypothetical protein ASPSYDRAFT_73546 [Aspergillus sydowii CBS 593.65]|uniref:Fcf2 pre-rRNA processing C-terminal domain-containing protein n=1 Tax=Aspergillus sydowii CBS 593.65 TaxID=1036612 RepID=A0A1L9SZH5_9EURO|nr:uncharacterized protein ASPSYDRAFT_73546 [Aspergillus sydowii CBS 593.65]OJJ52566.1 hypothetical protein ASPSYDRAFT_73546 [Aspergillus sydowii CBS 593.65]
MNLSSASDRVIVQCHNGAPLTDENIQQLLAQAEQRLCKNTETVSDSITPHQAEQSIPNIPKLSTGSSLKPYVRQHNDLAVIDTARVIDPITNNDNQSLASEQRKPKKPVLGCAVAMRALLFHSYSEHHVYISIAIHRGLLVDIFANDDVLQDKPTAGNNWYDLPKTELTPELKRDLQLLRMRSILDPKRHYKKENNKAQPPKYSQVGTIIEGPTEFFSGRIAKRDRKRTFVEEALVLEKENKRFETRYNDVQGKKRSGRKAFYKSLRAKRNSGGKNRH